MSLPKILVTSALPYANGHIHLGHLVEYVQTDIWVRFKRLMGHQVLFVCADDTHGTAIMLRARQEGRTPEAVIADMREAHMRDFADFDVRFDHYSSTHSDANRALAAEVWAALKRADLITQREVTQLYDVKEGIFLADRFVQGNCPRCDAPNQYGDSCDRCGSTYDATDLKNPVSVISGTTPELRSEQHLFVSTEKRHAFLEHWTQKPGHLRAEVAAWLQSAFLVEPLRDWDVSRPAPYFGFEIPGTEGKHFWFVWFDAPIGYIASTAEWCQANGQSIDQWWRGGQAQIHHFIGKDITYFHTLFWPVMLEAAGFDLPTTVHVHGFLTVDGEKMSKRKGTFVMARTYLEHLDPVYLRYYYASKLTPRLDNLDLNLDEFVTKVNSDLVGKVVNLASRTARFVESTGLAAKYPDDGGLFEAAATEGSAIAEAYEACDYNKAMRAIMGLADRANQYIDERAPWNLRKQPGQERALQDVCTVALNLFRQIALYLAPVLPRLASQTAQLLAAPMNRWSDARTPLVGTPVGRFEHLLSRVTPEQVKTMIESSKPPEAAAPAATDEPVPAASEQVAAAGATADGPEPLIAEPMSPTISFEEFAKVDLRVARIVAAEDVPKAKKILKLTLSLGGEERRTVFAGIKSAYQPEKIVGRLIIFAANLAPRQMSFGLSEGMVVASGLGGEDIYLLSPDSGAKPGQRIH